MNVIKLKILFLIVCLMGVSAACRAGNFQPRPEDEVIKLGAPGESPKSKECEYKHGDAVSLIENDGTFVVEAYIDKKDAERGYSVRIGSGRLTKYESYPPSQIFPAPWANYRNLKIGDAVYGRYFGNFQEKGIITYVPQSELDTFSVKLSDHSTEQRLYVKDVYSSVETAKPENLSTGDIVYYQNSYWAIVIGKRSGKIIVRRDIYPPEGDILVDASKLQIFKIEK